MKILSRPGVLFLSNYSYSHAITYLIQTLLLLFVIVYFYTASVSLCVRFLLIDKRNVRFSLFHASLAALISILSLSRFGVLFLFSK